MDSLNRESIKSNLSGGDLAGADKLMESGGLDGDGAEGVLGALVGILTFNLDEDGKKGMPVSEY